MIRVSRRWYEDTLVQEYVLYIKEGEKEFGGRLIFEEEEEEKERLKAAIDPSLEYLIS